MGLVEASAGTAEVMEWGALFQQTELFAILEKSVTSMLSEALHLAGLCDAPVLSAEGEGRAQSGLVRAMQPADEAYQRAVASARPTVRPSF
jgi:hypothetical protein